MNDLLQELGLPLRIIAWGYIVVQAIGLVLALFIGAFILRDWRRK